MGRPLDEASAAMILVHGRDGSAEGILQLARELGRPDVAYLAPSAAGNTWYPYSFLAPLERNEPYLSSALRLVGSAVDGVLAALEPDAYARAVAHVRARAVRRHDRGRRL